MSATQNYKFKSELLKEIKVTDFYLGKSGLEIGYLMPGKEDVLIATPEQALQLLKDLDLIADYKRAYGKLEVRIVYNRRSIAVDYDDFILDYNLSQYEALEIVAHVESQKQDSLLRKQLDAVALTQSLIDMGGNRA